MPYLFGLNDAKIAPWQNPQNWGTAVDLDGVQQMSVTLNTVNGILEGDDIIKAVHAMVISLTARVRFAFSDLAVWQVLTGLTVDSSPAVDSLTVNNVTMPYFGLVGKLTHDSGGGDHWFFCPKVKVVENLEIGGEYGRFVTPEIQVTGIYEGTLYGVFKIFKHATAASLVIPPF